VITVAALAPSLDLTYVVERLVPGEIHRPVEVVRCAGGKPLNMARAAARLGADAEVIAILGGATGRILRDALVEAGIATVEVPTSAETRTCVSIASREQDTLTEVYEYAAAVPPPVWKQLVAAVEVAVAHRPGWLSISGGPPRELPVEAIAELVRIGHRAGRRVALDTHGPALPTAVDARPDLVKINRAEATELLGESRSDLLELAEAVRVRSRGLVVLTDAHLGAVATDGVDACRARLTDVHGAFPVGSGDSFLGALVTELDRGSAWVEGLRSAVAAGAANALVPGPGRFQREVVEELRVRVRIDQL
jgi:1-phosphofructokinase family hexose kinase